MKDPFLPSASLDVLRQRALILSDIRRFFDQRGFFEVQTPVLSRDTVVDRYIEPISVELDVTGQPVPFWLQTSPEFGMKRLLAAGADAIYQIGPAFRAGEIGAKHNIEFTMLEWYHVGDNYQQGRRRLDEFSQTILQQPVATQLTYRQVFQRFVDFDPFDSDQRQQARIHWEQEASQVFSDDDDFLSWAMTEHVEPHLVTSDAVIIYDWPASQAALAQVRQTEYGLVAERFELYAQGIEVANGYHELTSPDELMVRNQHVNLLRKTDGRSELPENSRLVDAMRFGLPESCGVAAGVDRIVMLLTEKELMAEVTAFDSHRA